MPVKFPTDAWVKALQLELNQSAAYRQAAHNWEGDFYFVVSASNGAPAAYLYMDLWHGECRAAYAADGPETRAAEFTIEAPLAAWRKVISGQLDPIQGLMTRQLRLRGQLLKVMRAPRAATELVRCCTRIDTEWPAEPVLTA
jgi:putative sterol carrier protein